MKVITPLSCVSTALFSSAIEEGRDARVHGRVAIKYDDATTTCVGSVFGRDPFGA